MSHIEELKERLDRIGYTLGGGTLNPTTTASPEEIAEQINGALKEIEDGTMEVVDWDDDDENPICTDCEFPIARDGCKCEVIKEDEPMELWILKPRGYDTHDDDLGHDSPWEPWYDKAFGMVVRAPDEETARAIAAENAGDEAWKTNPWLDPALATCDFLIKEGEHGLVLRDFASA
jgi:hypothetical protein